MEKEEKPKEEPKKDEIQKKFDELAASNAILQQEMSALKQKEVETTRQGNLLNRLRIVILLDQYS